MMDYKGILLRPIASLRKEQVLRAKGDVLAIYNANKPIIQNLLEHSGLPESDHNLWIGIYRIGVNQDEARPTIVVCCLDSKLRKQAKESIKNCSLFRQGGAFAHFAVRGKPIAPDLPCEPQLTMEGNSQVHGLAPTISSSTHQPEELTNQGPEGDIREHIEHPVVLRLFGSHTGDSYLCRPIQALRGLQRQSATAGPLLFLDGISYQLTVEHVVDFSRHKSEPTWEHTNDDWDDDDDDNDDDTGGNGHVEDIVPSDFSTVRTMSEGSVSSEDVEINFSSTSSSSSAEEIDGNISWSPVVPASAPPPQSPSESRTAGHIIVNDHSSSLQIEPISSPTRCYTSAKVDFLLFPIHVNPDPEVCTTGGAEMVQLSDLFDVHGQTEARPVIISTASLGYVQGIIFPASTLLQRPGSRSFQTLFCIESAFPMPKGTSGSAVFDSQTGLLAGYLALGCPGKHTCYMVPMCDVLAELNMLSSSIVRCQVQLNVSAIAKVNSHNSALTRFSFHADGLNRSVPLCSVAPREGAFGHNNRSVSGSQLGQVPNIFPNLTIRVGKSLKTENPRNPLKITSISGYFNRITTATLEWVSEPADKWRTRFGGPTKLIGSVENRPLLDTMSEVIATELWTFFEPRIPSARWERSMKHIQQFCEGASFAFDGSAPKDAETPMFEDVQEPRAWVSDRNSAPEGSSYPQPNYPRVLDNQGLYQALQKKRFRDDACDDTSGHCRRVYVSKPNGSSVLALMRTTPGSQIEGFCQLFVDYITPAPEPKMILRESGSWGGCFILSFNLPFFGVQYEDDSNVSPNGKRPFRCRRSLSFLNLNSQVPGISNNDDPTSLHPTFLQETVWSFMATGKSERYWTAVFLDEDSFDDEPRLPTDEELVELGGHTDPITLQEERSTTTSPRSYALAALATALNQIVEHHTIILDWLKTGFHLQISAVRQDPPSDISSEDIQGWINKFKSALEPVTDGNSRLLLKLDHFLHEDVMLDMDGLPRGPLWRSLQSDANSLMSLSQIKQYRNQFRDIECDFHLLSRKVKEETKNCQLKKENVFFRQPYLIATVQLAITLLLLEPLIRLGPEALDPLTWTELLITLMLITIVSGCIFYLRRTP